MDTTQALLELVPGTQWVCRGDSYDGIEWLDETQSKPTRAQVEAKIAELKAAEPTNLFQQSVGLFLHAEVSLVLLL
jgi:hypothetical protein